MYRVNYLAILFLLLSCTPTNKGMVFKIENSSLYNIDTLNYYLINNSDHDQVIIFDESYTHRPCDFLFFENDFRPKLSINNGRRRLLPNYSLAELSSEEYWAIGNDSFIKRREFINEIINYYPPSLDSLWVLNNHFISKNLTVIKARDSIFFKSPIDLAVGNRNYDYTFMSMNFNLDSSKCNYYLTVNFKQDGKKIKGYLFKKQQDSLYGNGVNANIYNGLISSNRVKLLCK